MDVVTRGRYNPQCRVSFLAESPISPELVLVAPPEEAERARRALPLPAPPLPRFPDILSSPAVRDRARRRRRIVLRAVGLAVLGAFATAAAFVVLRDSRTGERAVQSQPRARAVAPKRTTAPRRAAPKTAPRPSQTTAAKPATSPTPTVPKRQRSTPSQTPPARPKTPKATKKPPGPFVPARVFAWPAQTGAVAYVVRFFRGSSVVLERRTTNERLSLPSSFRFRPGSYRWQVLPVDEHGARGAPIVESRFHVT
jgi:hypothetical protein